jgi:hypothetical protein
MCFIIFASQTIILTLNQGIFIMDANAENSPGTQPSPTSQPAECACLFQAGFKVTHIGLRRL